MSRRSAMTMAMVILFSAKPARPTTYPAVTTGGSGRGINMRTDDVPVELTDFNAPEHAGDAHHMLGFCRTPGEFSSLDRGYLIHLSDTAVE